MKQYNIGMSILSLFAKEGTRRGENCGFEVCRVLE